MSLNPEVAILDTACKPPSPPRSSLVSLASNHRFPRGRCLSARTVRSTKHLEHLEQFLLVMSLQFLYELDRSFPNRLDKLLHDQEYVEELQGLPEQELLQLVDYLNDVCSPMSWRPSSLVSQVLVRLDRIGGKSRKCLQVLRRICGSRKILPTNYELSKELLLSSERPKSSGGFCDAYEGTLSVKVCIKRLTISVICDREKIREVSVHLTSW